VTPATPPAVSTVQNIPAAIVTGEASKLIAPIPPAVKNIDLNAPTTAQNTSTVSEVKPVTPEAVNPVVLGASLSTDLKANFDQSKTTNNNSTPELLPLVPNLANLPLTGTDPSTVTANVTHANVPKPDSVQILNQVTNQITVHASEARAVSRMSFQLIPESLGRVTIQIALVDQSLSARFIVSNPVVKEALQHHMIELKTALNQSGLQIDQLQVQVQGGGSNLLAQYYQYQQEGFAAGLPGYGPAVGDEANSVENTGVSEVFSSRNTLVDMLV
jgi:flagellar hook-length control protein FliK